MGEVGRRSFLGWLREYVGDRRRSPRRGARFAARIPAAVHLLEAGAEFGRGASGVPTVAGETRDLGPSGLTLFVGSVRVRGQYLTDAGHQLGVKLELPAGEVSLIARAVRFEHPPEGQSGYLLGVRILKVRGEHLSLFSGFLRTLAPVERRRMPGENVGEPLRYLGHPFLAAAGESERGGRVSLPRSPGEAATLVPRRSFSSQALHASRRPAPATRARRRRRRRSRAWRRWSAA